MLDTMIHRDTLYFRIFCCTFWVIAVSFFIFREFLPFLFPYRNNIYLFSDFILFALGCVTLRTKGDKILILAFLCLAIFSSVINRVPTLLWINGLRDYFPLLLGLPVLRYFFLCPDSEKYRKSFDRQLFIFLCIQPFCTIEEFIRYGAGDDVGGSLGPDSGGLSLSVITISFYFVCKNWDPENYLKSLWRNKWYIFLMFPVFLNETKVSFVLLALYFILLYPFSLKGLGRFIVAIPIMIIGFILLVLAYLAATGLDDDITSSDFIALYLTGGDEKEDIIEMQDYKEEWTDDLGLDFFALDLPRFMKVGMTPEILSTTRGGLLLGAGAGHMKGGNTLALTQFYTDNEFLFNGTRMSLHLFFIPFGILGIIWAIIWYCHALGFKYKKNNNSLRIKLFLAFIAVLCFFYHEYFRYFISCTVFYYVALSTIYPQKKDISTENESSFISYRPGL